MPAKVKFGRAQVGFCPCGRILFRGSTVTLCGSVARRPESPSFLIPIKDTARLPGDE